MTIFTPSLTDTRRDLRERTNTLIANRLRAGLLIMLLAIVMFAIDELWLNPSEIVPLSIVKAIQVGMVVVVLPLLGRPLFSKHAVPIAVATLSVFAVTAAASNILRHDIALTPLLLIIVTMGAPTLFPWGLGPQIVIVAVAWLAVAANVYLVTGSLSAIVGYGPVAVAVAFVASLYVAHELDRYRLAIEQRNLALHGYAEVVESANDIIYTLDLDGNFRSVNRAVEGILGYTRDDVLKMNVRDIVPPEYVEIARQSRDPEVRPDTPVIYELEVIAKDGRRVPIEVNSRLVLQDGRPVGVLGFARDITERWRTRAAWQDAKDAAEHANQAKSEFLASMSHEIRTPMNGIIGMTELLLNTDLTSEQREHLSLVQASAESLLTVINDILDFSKIEAGKLDLDPIPFNLRDAVAETIKTLAMRARQKNLELRFRIPGSLPDTVVGDVTRLRQILVNLIGNAIKFTSQGEVVVEVEPETSAPTGNAPAASNFTSAPDHCWLHLSVRDTGIGIAPDKQQMIFHPFEQADGSTTRRYGGSGLGLAISSKLVELMGGRIWVDSAPGRGSTFHFVVPFGVHESAAASAPAHAVQPRVSAVGPNDNAAHRPRGVHPPVVEGQHHFHILLAEDNIVNQELAVRMLARHGHTVVVANNGNEALAALDRERFDLVLMDVQMPDMDGLETTQEIRKREAQGRQPRLPIIALTAHAMKGDRERCLAAGMDDYVSKPINVHRLFDAVESLVAPPPISSGNGGDAVSDATDTPTTLPVLGNGAHSAEVLIDPMALLSRVDGDTGLLEELIDLFLQDSPRQMGALKEALARHDLRALQAAAHSIKGSASNFIASAVVEAALRIESLAREGDLNECSPACAALEAEMASLNTALAALRAGPLPEAFHVRAAS